MINSKSSINREERKKGRKREKKGREERKERQGWREGLFHIKEYSGKQQPPPSPTV